MDKDLIFNIEPAEDFNPEMKLGNAKRDGVEREYKQYSEETEDSECVILVNGSTKYGSILSLGSIVDPKEVTDAGIGKRRRKKFSMCSNLSTVSNSSEQPYLAMMRNNSRERKLSSLSSSSSVIARQSSEESVKNSPEGISPFLPTSRTVDGKMWTSKNHVFANKKKISLRKISRRESTKRKVELFPGYEKYVQDRAKERHNVSEIEGSQEEQVCLK